MENIHFDDRKCFVEDISNILQRGSANDIKIKVDNGEIYANKEILAARCEYFKLMFRNRFSEVENNVIDLSYLSIAHLRPLSSTRVHCPATVFKTTFC